MIERRTLAVWGYGAAALLGAVPLMVLPFLIFGPARSGGEVDGARILVATSCATAGLAWGLTFAGLSYRRSDEFNRAASRHAWHWGGLFGLAASMPLAVFIGLGGLHWAVPAITAGRTLGHAFAYGYGLAVFAQFAGAVAALAWWKLSRR